ncbi:ROK family protein [Streptomyces umbrinus]|uniref:ROK family protein n=1 Tax=Streptomyces umbrinus TaxID=67370 RepID=UPI0034094471
MGDELAAASVCQRPEGKCPSWTCNRLQSSAAQHFERCEYAHLLRLPGASSQSQTCTTTGSIPHPERRAYRGTHGMAGELGHIPVGFSHPNSKIKCRCQSPGCLEGATAPYAIARKLAEEGISGAFDAAVPDVTTSGGRIRTAFDRAGEALGRAIATLINLFNPSAIVLIGPQALVGTPETFRNGADAAQEGATGLYMRAVERTINDHAFSTSADDCEFGRCQRIPGPQPRGGPVGHPSAAVDRTDFATRLMRHRWLGGWLQVRSA